MSEPSLVTQEAIRQMTGRTQPAAQLRRLRALGLQAWRNAVGDVCLTTGQLLAWRGPQANEEQPRPKLRSVNRT